MAKKSTKKTTTETPEVAPIENIEVVNANTEVNVDTIIEEATKNIPEEIDTIKKELENVKPSDEIMTTIIAEPEKAEEITSQYIDGKKCIIIPVTDDEQITINGIDTEF